MKVKLFFLSLGAVILTYLIFTANTHQEIKITTIYDETTTVKENFSTFLQKDLEKLLPTTINDYHKKNLEIENTIDKIKNTDEIIQLTRGLSMELVAFCSLLLTRSNELAEMKKACLYVIQKYQNLTSEGDKKFFNQAIQNVIKRMKIRELSTYALDQEIKLLMSFYSENC